MLYSIQALRAIAAWSVVFTHFAQVNLRTESSGFDRLDPVFYSFRIFGGYGVDLFFLISGFVLFHSTRSESVTPLRFVFDRIRRIAPAYWLATLVLAFCTIVVPGLVPATPFDLTSVVKSLFFVPSPHPSGAGPFPFLTVGWTLIYEMMFYVVFAVVLLLPRPLHLPGITIGLVLLQVLLKYIGGTAGAYASPIMYEFAIGALIAHVWERGWLEHAHPLAALCTVSVAIVAIVAMHGKSQVIWVGLPCAGMLAAAVSQERLFSAASVLTWLGERSYSTYIWHAHVLYAAAFLSLQCNISSYAMLAPSSIAILCVSLLSYELIERRFRKSQGRAGRLGVASRR